MGLTTARPVIRDLDRVFLKQFGCDVIQLFDVNLDAVTCSRLEVHSPSGTAEQTVPGTPPNSIIMQKRWGLVRLVGLAGGWGGYKWVLDMRQLAGNASNTQQ